ncbi:hypothetical protein KKA08_03285, partial [bacterium]|nr:hypothetical protein [bacterium]
LPAQRRFDWGAVWTYLTRELWNYPRRSALRWAMAGSFAVLLLLGATQIVPRYHEPVLRSNLTIGEMIITNHEGGKVYYSGSAIALTFHEEIDLGAVSRPTSASR